MYPDSCKIMNYFQNYKILGTKSNTCIVVTFCTQTPYITFLSDKNCENLQESGYKKKRLYSRYFLYPKNHEKSEFWFLTSFWVQKVTII